MTTRELIVLLELGLAYAILALGVFVTFRVLNLPDLTVEGSFTLGAVVGTVLTVQGHPAAGLVAGAAAGALAGLVTALLMTQCGVQPILSGILVMTGLYSVNMFVMGGKSNLPLMREVTVFTPIQALVGGGWHKVALLGLLVACLVVGVHVFFKTSMGLSIRATGDNEKMVRCSSVSTDGTKALALALANALVGLSGAVVAQVQQFADVGMGAGMVVIALASLIIGEAALFFVPQGILRGALTAVLGAVLYRAIVALVLKTYIPASSVKLLTALLVAIAVSYPRVMARIRLARRKGVARRAAH